MVLYAEPYIGALPVRFGMSPVEVAAVIGPPSAVLPGVFGTTAEARPKLMIGYDRANNCVYEVNCHVGTTLMFQGHDLLAHVDPIAFLRLFDPNPVLFVGVVLFLKLGIQVSGFHDCDESQKAISMFIKNIYADYAEDFAPF